MDQAEKSDKEAGSVGVPPTPEARQDPYEEYSTEEIESDSDDVPTPIMSETEEATTPKKDVKKEQVKDVNANEQVLPDSTTDDAPEASAAGGAQAAADVAYEADESSESSHGSLWTPEGEENSDTTDGESGSGSSTRKPATVSECSEDEDEEWLPAGVKKRKSGKQRSKKGPSKRSK